MSKPFRLHRGYVVSFTQREVEPFSFSWWVNALDWATDQYQMMDELTEISNAPKEYWDEWERYKKMRVWIFERIKRKESK
jgi:hypothetical protein